MTIMYWPLVIVKCVDISDARKMLESEPFQRGDCLYTSESDVSRRQILTYKDGPRTERIEIFLTAVDP